MKATAAWERFWFAEGSPDGLAAFRIGFALCLLREVETSRARSLGALSGGFHWPYASWLPRFPEPWFDLIHSAQYPLIVLLAIGLATRGAALGLVVLQGAIFFADRLQFRNHPWFFLIVLALLACSPAGEALSLRAWRRKRSGRSAIARPLTWQRLIQVQVSIVYVFAALHKLHPAYLRGDVLRAWLDPAGATELALLPVLAAATVALEIGLAFALWWQPTRLVAVVAGVLFHATIAAALGAGAFSLALISSYILFFDPDDFAQLVAPSSGAWRGGGVARRVDR